MAESEHNGTEYKPTTAEKKLLEVLLNPANRFDDVTTLCSKAGIGRTTYYAAYAKPGFVALQEQMAKNLVKQAVLPTIHAFAKQAARGSHQHGETILEMAGIYMRKMRQEHTGKDGGPIETTGQVTHEHKGEITLKDILAARATSGRSAARASAKNVHAKGAKAARKLASVRAKRPAKRTRRPEL